MKNVCVLIAVLIAVVPTSSEAKQKQNRSPAGYHVQHEAGAPVTSLQKILKDSRERMQLTSFQLSSSLGVTSYRAQNPNLSSVGAENPRAAMPWANSEGGIRPSRFDIR